MKSKDDVRLLIIGQTPPPYLGQMLSIEILVKAQYSNIRVYHTRLNYSQTTAQIGKVSIRKILHLIRIIVESSYKIIRHRIDVIYYPPGAETIPILRDIATLLVLRRFRRKLILVFHASGLCERVNAWHGILAWLFRKAFFSPDAAVRKSSLNPPDSEFVKARAIYTVPNGCADQFERFRRRKAINMVPVILFVGLIREDKGVEVLIEAARLLKARGLRFRVQLVGDFASEEYGQKLLQSVSEQDLEDYVEFCGAKVGDDKWSYYRGADIFCFPSYYSSESFGVVLVEAMMFELPVVATNWRGIPSIVEDEITGFLTEIQDPPAVANKLSRLLNDEKLRIRMGREGRERYLEKFTIETYVENIRTVVLEVANEKHGHRSLKNRERRRVTA